MRIPRKLQAAGLIVAAVLLGLLTVQGTYALWAVNASVAPGTVRSAAFTVNLTGQPSGQSTNMTLEGGQAASLAITTLAAPLAELTPGTSVIASVTVGNTTNAGGPFSVAVTAGAPAVSDVDSGSLGQYLTVAAAAADSTAACPLASYFPLSGGVTTAAIPKGASTVLCFKVTMDLSAPLSVSGHAVNISIPLTASQV